MTYWRYWDLNGAPFTGGTLQPLFRGATVEEAIARVDFLVSNRRNVGLLVGPSGVGKSSILRHIAVNPPTSGDVPNVKCIRTSMLGLSGGELVYGLAAAMTGSRKLADPDDSGACWTDLCDYFHAAYREDVQTVLLLDDVESATKEGESDLCRILSMAFPLTVILAVERELLGAVSRGLLERTELQIELPGWEVHQTAEFLAWSILRTGRKQPIFTDRAIEKIQQLSLGIPRRIVQVADLSLVAGAVSQADCVDEECIDQVAFELPRKSAA